jgi:hypothetical protein
MNDKFGIVANVLNDRVLRTGAKVWISHGDLISPFVFGISKSGRVVGKYMRYKRLIKYRVAWIPMHMRERIWFQYSEKKDAEKFVVLLKTIS